MSRYSDKEGIIQISTEGEAWEELNGSTDEEELHEGYISFVKESNSSNIYPIDAKSLANLCHQNSKEAGWWDGVNPKEVVPTKLCLIHSEISEAMEGDRKNLMDDKLPHRKMIEVELADAVIRIFDLAGALKLNVVEAMLEKMEFNKVRKDHKKENREAENGKKY